MKDPGKNMSILLTGGTGFLGAHLIPRLLERPHDLVVLNKSCFGTRRIDEYLPRLRVYDVDKTGLEDIFSKENIGLVIHLATDFGRVDRDVVKMSEANIQLPLSLLDLCVKHGCLSFINSHTSLPANYNLYAAMKSAALEIIKYYASDHDVRVVNITMDYLYGEKDDRSKFLPFLIESILAGKTVDMTGGEQKRDFVYVEDAVAAFTAAADNIGGLKPGFLGFRVGTGVKTKLSDVVALIQSISGKKAAVNRGIIPYFKNEIFEIEEKEGDSPAFGWRAKFDLEKGLTRLIDWYRKSAASKDWFPR